MVKTILQEHPETALQAGQDQQVTWNDSLTQRNARVVITILRLLSVVVGAACQVSNTPSTRTESASLVPPLPFAADQHAERRRANGAAAMHQQPILPMLIATGV